MTSTVDRPVRDMRPIDVCICTHNPRRDVLAIVLSALAGQTVSPKDFRVLLIDNACTAPLDSDVLVALRARGIEARIVREERLGLAYARLRAIGETDGDWVLFVDDDNELQADFIACGRRFAQEHPEVGCFGGRMRLPPHLKPPASVRPFLGFLGIKDGGEKLLISCEDRWGPWEPAGAGAWVHRKVLREYQRRAAELGDVLRLGRRGAGILASCDDSLMMRSASRVCLANSYVPELVLDHHLDRKRFEPRYLVRLMRAYGASHVLLEHLLAPGEPLPGTYASGARMAARAVWDGLKGARHSLLFAVGRFYYHLGAHEEVRRLTRQGLQ